MRLYELSEEYEQLLEIAEETDISGPELAQRLELVGAKLEQKCAGIAKVLATLDAQAAAYETEAARLAAKSSRATKKAKRLREYVRASLHERGVRKLQSETFSFSIVSCPAHVEVDDISKVPSEYIRKKVVEEVSVDKRAVLSAFEDCGVFTPGTRVERSVRLVIK